MPYPSEHILILACTGCSHRAAGTCPYSVTEKDSCPKVRKAAERQRKDEN